MTSREKSVDGPVTPVESLRLSLGLSLSEFSQSYLIPIDTLRDWETRICEPHETARAYLKVIATNPEMVRLALAS
jgi:putative transcriptional regulator